jgi:hypothetical protein
VAQPRFLARELIALPQFIASSGPRPSGVAWVSATLPVPSPSVMCITIVRLSGHVNSLAPGPPGPGSGGTSRPQPVPDHY